MANLIEATRIEGGSVYGVAQMSYTVDGVSGRDYAAALTAAAFKESVAIETTAAGYAEVVRQRERKLDDLGTVMAALNKAAATLKVKDTESGDWTDDLAILAQARSVASKYGITINFAKISYESGSWSMTMTREQVYKAQNEVQYAIDREDNDLKQDMVSLQSLVSKRDNAFSTASKVVKKALNAASDTISNMG